MFGYLRPYKEELKLKDIKLYSAYYCALCNQIRKSYGILWTFFLTYESVYILIFLESIINLPVETVALKCHLNPLKKGKILINQNLLEYAAFINMILIDLKFRDDEYDEKKVLKKLLKFLLEINKKYKVAETYYCNLSNEMISESELLKELESKSASLDVCADTTANMLKSIIDNFFQINTIDNNISKISILLNGYVGKLIYILDAYEDFECDRKKGQFNPIIFMHTPNSNEKEALVKTEKILRLLKLCIAKEIEDIKFVKNEEIVENILTYGIEYSIDKIGKERKKRGN